MIKRGVGIFIVLWGVWAAVSPAASADYAKPDTCGACHSDEYESWKPSIHSKAYESESFQKAWAGHKKDPSCLECHTTGHKAGTLEYAAAGVTCESCHGAMSEGHPDTAKMPIPASSEMCLTCHKKTYQEWKVSNHGIKGIRCFDCHNVHAQGLRAGGGDTLCGSCHQNRLTDFAHSSHHLAGLKCSTCHMPEYKTHDEKIQGTGSAGHTLSVGAEVCSRCHEETVHKSAEIPELREKVSEINQQISVAGVHSVFDLNEKVKELQWQLARSQQGMWVAGILFLIFGLSLGWLGGWYLYGRKRPPQNGKPS